jgi:peptidyl-prolyl cis-trans isomerase C
MVKKLKKKLASKKINKNVLIILIILILAILSLVLYSKSKSYDDGPFIAKINGKKISSIAINKFLQEAYNAPSNFQLDSLPKSQLENIILQFSLEKELLKAAKTEKIAKREDIALKIEKAKTKIVKEAFLEEISNKATTRSALEAEYKIFSKKIAEQLKDKQEYKAQHILSKTKAESQAIYRKIINNKDSFENLAKSESIDHTTAEKGGDLGYFIEGNMVPEFENKVKSLALNKLSTPFKSKFGWHIVIVQDRREAQVPPLEDIYEQLKSEVSYKAITKYIEKLKSGVKVEILASSNNEIENNATQDEKPQDQDTDS